MGEDGFPEWTVVVADLQTRGRGRNNTVWESSEGGLWFSILLRPQISSTKLPLLQFLAATASRRAIEKKTGLKVLLKWPNDLVTRSGKLGGILVESKTIGEKVVFVILGIGINVNQKQNTLPPGAVSLLQETHVRTERLALLKTIVRNITSSLDEIVRPQSMMREWWRHCIHRNARVQITGQKKTINGIARRLDDGGALILETNGHRTMRIIEGTLRVRDD